MWIINNHSRALDLATGEIVAVKKLYFENGELDHEILVTKERRK